MLLNSTHYNYYTQCVLNAVQNIYTTHFLLSRIDGPHNKVVLATVQAEMLEKSEDCSLSTIRSMIVCDCVVSVKT